MSVHIIILFYKQNIEILKEKYRVIVKYFLSYEWRWKESKFHYIFIPSFISYLSNISADNRLVNRH